MSKNLVVGGMTYNGISTINVATVDGGTSTWIPEDEISDHANLTTLVASHNGTYRPRGSVDGYDEVFVNVKPDLVPITVTRNGIYKPTAVVTSNGLGSGSISIPAYDGYSEVRVNVPNGGASQTLIAKGIVQNGIYNASDDAANGYLSVSVNVPNTYAQSDEGKVVSSGALVSQTSKTISENGQYATMTNNSVTVNVPNSYTQSDEGKVVDGGALVSQSSQMIRSNGTYDTTTKNEVIVEVPDSILGAADGYSFSDGVLSIWGANNEVVLKTKSVSQNGTYFASADSATGYSQVTVNVSGGSSPRKAGIGPYMSIMPYQTSSSGISNIDAGSYNIVTDGMMSQDSIGHTVIIMCACASAEISNMVVSGFTALATYGNAKAFLGTLAAETTITVTATTMCTMVEISDDYEASLYANLCGSVDESNINTDYLKTAYAFKVSAKLPIGYGIMFLASDYDYSSQEYRPTVWQPLNMFIAKPEIILRRIDGSHRYTGTAAFLKMNTDEYNQYYLRGSVTGKIESGSLRLPSTLTSLESVNAYNTVPTWASKLDIIYIQILPKVS